ncbi:pupal cuticle protein 36-like [Penaeus monodon]|uniref:pupal cuticle protein 36-like n=1 Tax=Penaeus monodon TaxID=6687 RepID=UPI0018A73C9A|nr:pupal cuticle protein 36-like [Penaeus monodon]
MACRVWYKRSLADSLSFSDSDSSARASCLSVKEWEDRECGAGGSGGFGGGAPGSGSGGSEVELLVQGSGGFGGGGNGGFGGGAPGAGMAASGSGATGGFCGGAPGAGATGRIRSARVPREASVAGAGASRSLSIPIITDERQGPRRVSETYNFQIQKLQTAIISGTRSPTRRNWKPSSTAGFLVVNSLFPDGTPADFNFVADENGFRVESDLRCHTPSPPRPAIAQIERLVSGGRAAAASGGRPCSGSGKFLWLQALGRTANQALGSGQFSGSAIRLWCRCCPTRIWFL